MKVPWPSGKISGWRANGCGKAVDDLRACEGLSKRVSDHLTVLDGYSYSLTWIDGYNR